MSKEQYVAFRFLFIFLLILAFALVISGQQPPVDGGVIQDGRLIIKVFDPTITGTGATSSCIQPTDTILMTMPRMIIKKKDGLFKKDEQAGLQTSIIISGRVKKNQTYSPVPAVNYNKITLVSLADYGNNTQVSLPVAVNIIELLPLTSGNTKIDNVEIKIFMLKKRGSTNFGFAIRELAEFSQQFPLPLDPLSQEALRSVAKLTSGLLSEENKDGNNINKIVPAASITLNFSPNGVCDPNSWGTGAYVIVDKSDDKNNPGFVDIGANLDIKCFVIQTSPFDALLVGTKGQQSTCTNTKPVTNNYTLFRLTKYSAQSINALTDNPVAITYPNKPSPVNNPILNVLGAIVGISNTASIIGANISPQTPVMDVLKRYSWYSSLNSDFKDKLLEVAVSSDLTEQNTSESLDADITLANEIVKAVQMCLATGIVKESCALPMPPDRVLKPSLRGK